MTDICILIGAALLLAVCAWIYLVYEDFVGDNAAQKLASAFKKNKKVDLYILVSFLVLSGLAIEFELLYPTNTLIANMKLITLAALLITATVTDLRKQIIPNKIILAGLALRAVFAAAELITLGNGYFDILKQDLLSLALVVIIFLLCVLLVKNGMGMGDIKLLLVMGLFQGLTGVISSLFFSLVVSFFISVFLLVTRKKTRKDAIAFAPSMMIGTVISMVLTGI